MAGWPSLVEMRVTHVTGPKTITYVQRFLWMGFEEGGARRYEYQQGDRINIICTEPGFGIPLRARWQRTRYIGGSGKEKPCSWFHPRECETVTCTQIWTREACRAGVAVWLGMRHALHLDRSLCRMTARWIALSYERREWETAREK